MPFQLAGIGWGGSNELCWSVTEREVTTRHSSKSKKGFRSIRSESFFCAVEHLTFFIESDSR